MLARRRRSIESVSLAPETPWQRAETRWERWRRNPELRAHWWKVSSLLQSTALLVLLVGFILVVRQNRVVVHVVEVENGEKVRRIGVVEQTIYNPQEQLLKKTVQEWVENFRSVPRDEVVLGQNWRKAKALSTVPVQQLMNKYALDEGRSEMVKKNIGRLVLVETVLPLSERTFQVDWLETVTGHTEIKAAYRGMFEVVVQAPKDEAALRSNALGIYVSWFKWERKGA